MCAGVGKSGSPAPKPMTFSPAAFIDLALASTASVAEGWMAESRFDARFTVDHVTDPAVAGPRGPCRSACGRRVVAPGQSFDGSTRHAGEVSATAADIIIPDDLLPADGRFCCGPAKVRHEQVDAVVAGRDTILGTSHRKPTVKNLVGDV